jgi:hypothetical protein
MAGRLCKSNNIVTFFLRLNSLEWSRCMIIRPVSPDGSDCSDIVVGDRNSSAEVRIVDEWTGNDV